MLHAVFGLILWKGNWSLQVGGAELGLTILPQKPGGWARRVEYCRVASLQEWGPVQGTNLGGLEPKTGLAGALRLIAQVRTLRPKVIVCWGSL